MYVPGNHDICMDKKWPKQLFDPERRDFAQLDHQYAMELFKNYDVKLLIDEEFIYEDVKFYGSPMTPSFHRQNWVFNADRGEEISKYWAKIPSDVNVLITHGPPYGILDTIPLSFRQSPDEDIHRGCKDLLGVIKKRLIKLKLHCFGHLHNHYGIVLEPVSQTRDVLFSNGSVLNEDYKQVVKTPFIITL